ncbi:MAG: hypothetical protein B6U87_00470 [Candidatus Aenigmarchaeota archaeon ex4484_52]|nr:MAG: hypothetical protein B6U87_00470 [Candidatus Aenigmarchaeota archaeon ex4484_52]
MLLYVKNKTAFEEFKNGKEKSLNFLVGKIMKETRKLVSLEKS